MWLTGFWLTFLFPYAMAIGIIFCLIDIPIRKSEKITAKQRIFIQVSVVLLPIIFILLKTQLINPRAEVIIVPKNFRGPYIVIYGVRGKPKLPHDGRDVIVRIPSNRILLTATTPEKTSDVFETYVDDGIHKYGTKTNYLSTYNGTFYNQEKQKNSFYYRAGFFHNNVDTFNYDTLDKWTSKILDSIVVKYQ
jgi:hypothetical protein